MEKPEITQEDWDAIGGDFNKVFDDMDKVMRNLGMGTVDPDKARLERRKLIEDLSEDLYPTPDQVASTRIANREIHENWHRTDLKDHAGIRYMIEVVVTRISVNDPIGADALQRFVLIEEMSDKTQAYALQDKIVLRAQNKEKNSGGEKGIIKRFFKWGLGEKKASKWPKESADGNSLHFKDGSAIVKGKIPPIPPPPPPPINK